MKIRFINNNLLLKIIVLSLWTGCLFTINTNIVYLINFKPTIDNKLLDNILIILNSARFFFPFLIFITSIIFIYIYDHKKISLFVVLFLLYAAWQTLVFFYQSFYISRGYLLHVSEKANLLDTYQFILSLIATSLTIHLASYFKNLIYKKLLIILIIFIFFISLYFSCKLVEEFFINTDITYLYSTKTLAVESLLAFQALPRVTGVSRMLTLLFILLFLLFIKEKNKIKYSYFFILYLLFILIYSMQSRGSFVGILILLISYILFFKEKLIKKFIIIFILFATPIISFEYFIKFKTIDKTSNNSINRFFGNTIKMKTLEEKDAKVDKITSGRSIIWKRAIEIIKEEKIILGYGPQADRYIFTKDLKLGVNNQKYHENVLFWDSNVSNAFIYSYLCGGLVGLCLLIIIYFLAIKEICMAIKIEKNFFNNSLLHNFSFIALIYLSLRGLFENSIALFSLDFCIYIVTYFIVKENNKKIHI